MAQRDLIKSISPIAASANQKTAAPMFYIFFSASKKDPIWDSAVSIPYTYNQKGNSIFLRKNLDGKEVRYDERVFGRDENDQGSGVASEGFF